MNHIVLDTNVLLTALRSNKGASYALLRLIAEKKFQLHLSVPLFSEYEDVLNRQKHGLDEQVIDDILDYLASQATPHEIFYLWRPFLKDPKDDHVLELAVKSNSQFIISYNKRDFAGIQQFGIKVLSPLEFLRHIGEIQ